MLHDLANDGDFVALKRAAEDTKGWRHKERIQKLAEQQKTAADDENIWVGACLGGQRDARAVFQRQQSFLSS